MSLEQTLREGFEALGLPQDGRMLERYRIYADFLAEKNAVMNLTAIEGEDEVARLHFLDCAALLTVCELEGKSLIDVGTGAGFPGLALKIACPALKLTLLDSLDKRIGFLRECSARLGFEDVACVHARAEEAAAEFRAAFDAAASRAVARLRVLSELCLPLVRKGGVFLAMKGPDCAEELEEAMPAIRLLGGELERVAGYTIPGTEIRHSLVIIRKTGDTPARYPRPWAQIRKKPL